MDGCPELADFSQAGRRGPMRRARLDRDAPEGEPALELGLDRQLGADLRLQAQLPLAVALLRARRGHERVEGAALVVVDPVDGLGALVAEREHGGQDAVAVAAGL